MDLDLAVGASRLATTFARATILMVFDVLGGIKKIEGDGTGTLCMEGGVL
jgi:hypothetical protein